MTAKGAEFVLMFDLVSSKRLTHGEPEQIMLWLERTAEHYCLLPTKRKDGDCCVIVCPYLEPLLSCERQLREAAAEKGARLHMVIGLVYRWGGGQAYDNGMAMLRSLMEGCPAGRVVLTDAVREIARMLDTPLMDGLPVSRPARRARLAGHRPRTSASLLACRS